MQEMILMSEIVLQTKIANRAAERLKSANENFDNIEVWGSIQSILVSSGNVSKILWPQKNKKYGERLRKLLQVKDNNPVSSRKFRNHFEHYDERVEEYFKNQTSTVYRDLAMNPSISSFRQRNTHRGYNSINNTLVFRGEVLDLNQVLNALEEIRINCGKYVLN